MLIFSATGLILSGCATSYTLKVDALKNREVEQNHLYSFVLVEATTETSEHDVSFQEAANYVKTALSGKGLYEAHNPDHADLIIEISYGIGPPRVDYITLNSVSESEIDFIEVDVIPITVYEKFVRLDCYTNQPVNGEETRIHLWHVNVSNVDRKSNLDGYIPIMVAAAVPYMGVHTSNKEKIVLKEDDDIVQFIKRGM